MPKRQGYIQYKNTRVIECSICSRQFNSEKIFHLHRKAAHNDSNFALSEHGFHCGKCGSTSGDIAELRRHQKKSCPFKDELF